MFAEGGEHAGPRQRRQVHVVAHGPQPDAQVRLAAGEAAPARRAVTRQVEAAVLGRLLQAHHRDGAERGHRCLPISPRQVAICTLTNFGKGSARSSATALDSRSSSGTGRPENVLRRTVRKAS